MNETGAPVLPATASALLSACEGGWNAIQAVNWQVPDVVLVLGTGVERHRLVKLGHWWDGRWTADGAVRGEVLLAGEALHLSPAQVFEVLLHEAAHGLNAARGVKDTSRGGRYHNGRFKAAAEELGLIVDQMPPYGWARTELGPEALETYEGEIAAIGEAMRIAQRLDPNVRMADREGSEAELDAGSTGPGRDAAARPAMCGCGRRMRMAPSALAQGPVVCGVCGQEFSTGQSAVQRRIPTRVDLPQAPGVDGAFAPQVRSEVPTPTIASLVATVEGALLLSEVCAWREARRQGDHRGIPVHSPEDLPLANGAARALLKLVDELAGDAIEAAGREFLVGELVVAGPHDQRLADLDGVELPPPGVLGTVIVIDPSADTLVVDFPIAGRCRLDASSAAAATLDYGYAEVAPHPVAPLIDLRTLPKAMPPDPPALTLVPELSW